LGSATGYLLDSSEVLLLASVAVDSQRNFYLGHRTSAGDPRQF